MTDELAGMGLADTELLIIQTRESTELYNDSLISHQKVTVFCNTLPTKLNRPDCRVLADVVID